MNKQSDTFSIEAVVSCDDRGQLVLPKELRKRLGINPGDKLALMNITMAEDQFCLTMIKTEALTQLLKTFMQPVVQQMNK